jgi:pilus assembly protein Flp/PilA
MLKIYVSLQNMLERISRNEEGQTAVEYGLVLALIAIVIVTAMAAGLGGVVTNVVGKINTALGITTP